MSGKNNSNLVEIRDLLKEEMDKFNAINDEIIENQNDFQKISDNYNQYNNLINEGGHHVNDLTKQEYYENMFLYFGFYFFFGCVIYVVSKRIPIHKILMLALKLIYKIIMIFFPHKKENTSISEKNINNISFINETNETYIGYIDGINKTNISFVNVTNETIKYFNNSLNETNTNVNNNISKFNNSLHNSNINNTIINNDTFNNNINNNITINNNVNDTNILNKNNSSFEINEDKNNSKPDNINDL